MSEFAGWRQLSPLRESSCFPGAGRRTTSPAQARLSVMSGHHTMENTHPFRRALGRRTHLFAHNGTLTGIEQTMDEAAFRYLPIGEIV